MMSFISKTGQALARIGLGVVGNVAVGVPAAASLLAVTSLAARGIAQALKGGGSTSRLESLTQTKSDSFWNRQFQLLNPYNLKNKEVSTKDLLAFAALSAGVAFAAFRGLSYFRFGTRILSNASWLVRNFLPVRFVAPSLCGLCK